MNRPIRPSAARSEAAKLERGEPSRLVLELSPATRKAIKVKAAIEGVTIKAYIIRLLEADGVVCDEP